MSESTAAVPPYVRRSLGALHAASSDDTSIEADTEPETDADADEFLDPTARGCEGLPPSYRMRHESHYVETLGRPVPRPEPPAAPAPPETTHDAPPAPLGAVAPAVTEALDAITAALGLLPAPGPSLRERVALAFARAELARARWLTEAAAALEGDPLPTLDEVQLGAVMGVVAGAFEHERRLTGDGPVVELPADPQPVFGDERLLTVALGAAVSALRGISDARGPVAVRIAPRQETATRVVEVAQGALRLSGEASRRFFDRGWSAHPAGAAGAMLLAAAQRIADAHGGSLAVEASATGGCRLLLQIPAA